MRVLADPGPAPFLQLDAGPICMIRTFFHILLLSVGLTYWSHASADPGRHLIDDARLPLEGARLTDFVPAGWTIETTVQEDLDGDGKADGVVELIETPPPQTEEDMLPERARALVILLQTQTGGYRRVALARRLLRCTACFGLMAGSEGGGAEIKVAKRVIIVEELWGSRETVSTRLRFRYEAKSARVALIGEDIETFDRATGSRHRESSNLLTGIKLTETERYDEKQDRFIKISKKKQRIPRAKRFIEDIDYQSYEH